ncbi:hypothetical protein C369_07467 [Cryptococcus neoformans A5-35-17]|nr:hypothetical protein C369_07467 [Cryptococcus neoformans var. grubii A5-35-17]
MSGHAHFLSPNRTGNSRDDGDIVNMYQYDREDSHNLHAPPPPLRSYSTENHHHTYHPNPLYPPVLEEDEQGYEKEVDAKGRYGSSRTKIYVDDAPDQVQSAPVKGSGGYKNPYDVYPARANEPKPHKSISAAGKIPAALLGEKRIISIRHCQRRIGTMRRRRKSAGGFPEGEGGEGEVSDDDSVSRQSEPPSAISTRATIGMGTRVNLSQADLRSERSGGSGGEPVRKGTKSSRSQAQIQQQQGSKAPRRLPDVPGFAAGPPYGS